MKLTGIEKDIYCEESRVRPKNSEVFHLISKMIKQKILLVGSQRYHLKKVFLKQ